MPRRKQEPTLVEELNERLRFETLLSDLIASFVNLPPTQLDAAIEEVLRQLGEALDADRLTLAQPSADSERVFITHLYQARKDPAYPHPDDASLPEGVALAEGLAESLPPYKRVEMNKVVPWLISKCRQGEKVMFSGREDLPEEAVGDRAFFSKFGTQSLVAVPLVAGNRWLGVLSVASFREVRVWPEALVKRFQLVARVLASALEQFRLRVEVEERLRFEILLADLSSRFVNLPPGEVDREIEGALRGVCEVLKIDNAVLWQWSPQPQGDLVLTHAYYAPDSPPPETTPRHEDFPWIAQRLLSGREVTLPSVEDLPAEAAVDLESARRFGVRSSLCLPLSLGGEPPIGILAFNTLRAVRDWPEELVQRFQLVAQVFTNALARRRAESRAEQLRQELGHAGRVTLLGELTATLAHEVNRPLAAILSNAQAARHWLASGAPDVAELGEVLDDIIADDKRAGQVIHRIRAMLQKQRPERERVDVNQLCREVASLLESELRSAEVQLRLELSPELLEVDASVVEMRQVILNLVMNALQAMRGAGSPMRLITLTTLGEAREVAILVRDTGPGLEESIRERLWEPFFTTKPGGLGIGLSICRRIVESHGGRLEAENRAGGGATFRFVLPLAGAP